MENMRSKNNARKTQSDVKRFTAWLQMIPIFETCDKNKLPPGDCTPFLGRFCCQYEN